MDDEPPNASQMGWEAQRLLANSLPLHKKEFIVAARCFPLHKKEFIVVANSLPTD